MSSLSFTIYKFHTCQLPIELLKTEQKVPRSGDYSCAAAKFGSVR